MWVYLSLLLFVFFSILIETFFLLYLWTCEINTWTKCVTNHLSRSRSRHSFCSHLCVKSVQSNTIVRLSHTTCVSKYECLFDLLFLFLFFFRWPKTTKFKQNQQKIKRTKEKKKKSFLHKHMYNINAELWRNIVSNEEGALVILSIKFNFIPVNTENMGKVPHQFGPGKVFKML